LVSQNESKWSVGVVGHWICDCAGKRFIYYCGPQVKLVSRDYQFAKEVLSSKYGFFERHPDDIAMFRDFVGLGLDNLTGEKWAIERRTLNSFFYQDVLKVRAGTNQITHHSRHSIDTSSCTNFEH